MTDAASGVGTFGKYELLRRIGAGGMAEVFLARQRGIDGFEKLVVIKRIRPHIAQERHFVRMFLDEARTAADLRHPNIVHIYDVGTDDDDGYFLAMEYLHGRDLRLVLKAYRKQGIWLPLEVALPVIRDAAEGLHYAHNKADFDGQPLGIVHRDVSPQNVLVTFEGATKIVDFGIAKAASKTTRTAPGVVMGKIGYMSPEQVKGAPVGTASDQFSLGVVLYELTTGTSPFARNTDLATMEAIRSAQVEAPSQLRPDYPPELEALVLRMLQGDPSHRLESCAEVAHRIEAVIHSQETMASRAGLARFMKELFPEEADATSARPPTGRAGRGTRPLDEGDKSQAPTEAYPATPLGERHATATELDSVELTGAPTAARSTIRPRPLSAFRRVAPWTAGVFLLLTALAFWRPWSQEQAPTPTPTALAIASPVRTSVEVSTPLPTPTAAEIVRPPATPRRTRQPTPAPTKHTTPTPRATAALRPGFLDVKTQGSWVEVWVDGRRVAGETPLSGFTLSAGRHRLGVINRHANIKLTRDIEVRPETTTVIIVDVPGKRFRKAQFK